MSPAFKCILFTSLALAPSAVCASGNPGLRVAMAQIPLEDGDLARNMGLAREAIAHAAEKRADLVCLPEAADLGWLWQQSRRDALPIPGRYTRFLSDLAVKHRVWVCAGCLERAGDRVYNSAVLIDRRGEIVLKHRKIVTLPEITSHLYDTGSIDDIQVVDTEFGKVGITICADNFNIEIPRRVAKQGAWLLLAPHGFAADEDDISKNARDYQEHIRSVARETGMWVVGCDAVLATITGGKWKGKLHSGCSTVANPEGDAVAVGKLKQPDLVICDIPAAE